MDERQTLTHARDVLVQARALIAPPGRWARGGALARDARGRVMDPDGPCAERWCVLGAVLRAAKHEPSQVRVRAIEMLASAAGDDVAGVWRAWDTVSIYNDTHGKRAVLALCDAAIDAIDAHIDRVP